MSVKRIAVVGGGAAGFFAAVACAASDPAAKVVVFEKGAEFLGKVRISGGGRCNVTHGCFDPGEFTSRYPRGERALIGPFHQFDASDTVEWFESRGVRLKTEADGRMFPVTDDSQTIIDCLLREARAAGVELRPGHAVGGVDRREEGFRLTFAKQPAFECDRLLLATGGCRTPALGALAVSLGHSLEPPVPSLFSLHVESPWVRELAGLSVPSAQVSLEGTALRERGPVLFTHTGVSGPAVLRLSAWGAREFHARNYHFPLSIHWLPERDEVLLRSQLKSLGQAHPARAVANTPLAPIPARLWSALAGHSGLAPQTRWAHFDRAAQLALVRQLARTELPVSGKSLNKDEFVTCGGVRLQEVDFKTMQSRICPGLFFAGELLDLDGITGGFNFQAAWTTGWIAGRSLARS